MPAPLSIVIPTLNAAADLPLTAATLMAGVSEGLVRDLVISDGGSTDATASVAADLGATWVEGAPGRGAQIARGVAAATAPWVLILHADTRLSPNWVDAARHHMERDVSDAATFRLRFRADGLAPRIVAGGANLRTRILGLPYGDQGLLAPRALLDEVGVPDAPLMEDVILARRLRGRLRTLDAEALTSAARYQSDGWARRVGRNLWTLTRFAAGTPPERLVRGYSGRDD